MRLTSHSSAILLLLSLTGVLGYAVFQSGAVLRPEQYMILVALGLLGLVYLLLASRLGLPLALDRGLRWPIVLLPCYVALQLLPLPLFVLRVLSPARAELVDALSPVVSRISLAPLSVYPSATLTKLLLVGGYTVVFLLVRAVAGRMVDRPWVPVLPVIVIASLEALLGLAQFVGGAAEGGHGTYVNRNHFAGFLEMALPFAIMYPIAVLKRAGHDRPLLSGGAGLKACIGWAAAALVFVGLICSFSRMGLVASLGSLFLLRALAVGRGLSGRKRWLALSSVAVAAVLTFIFLPPTRFILRFSRLSSTAEIQAEWGI